MWLLAILGDGHIIHLACSVGKADPSVSLVAGSSNSERGFFWCSYVSMLPSGYIPMALEIGFVHLIISNSGQ